MSLNIGKVIANKRREKAWTQEQPMTDPKQKDRNGSEGLAFGGGPPKGVRTITEIMHDILAYPVESKSPMESMLFLAAVKEQIARLI